MNSLDRALLMLIHSCTILSDHMVNCDDTDACSARDFLRATVSKSFMQWLMLHGISEQTIYRAEKHELHAQIIEDLLEVIDALITGDKGLEHTVAEIRAKTAVAADQIRSTTPTMMN
jgi:hypothetical protein